MMTERKEGTMETGGKKIVAMADAFTSALVDQFVSSALAKIDENVGLVQNVKKDVKRLKKSLKYIQDLLVDAGTRQLDSQWLKQWLSDLEDISFDMDDVLDEWNSAILKCEIEKFDQGGKGIGEDGDESSDRVCAKKVCFPALPSSWFCFKKVNQVIRHYDFAKRIKKLTNELDSLKKDGHEHGIVLGAIGMYAQQQYIPSSIVKSRITTISMVEETEIHGRDDDKEILVSKLICDSSQKSGKGIDIIPIVGMGGLGKTTLAQLAYNDDSVKAHFDKRIWVCVSDPFDQKRVAKAIVDGLGGNAQNYDELESLVQCISNSIKGIKFLLVLDDVWTEEKLKWEQLKQPLMQGGAGSRILVTTRKDEVTIMMRAITSKITLKKLSDEQCWFIIRQLVFVEGEENEVNLLEEIGRKIASKCKGLPLVAKVLGGLMYYRKSLSQWNDILQNKLWDSKVVEEEIFAPLMLSFYDLSPLEKCCYSYCSLFPKDYRFERDTLIDMWMSQGYVGDSKTGQECFDSLVMRSFFDEYFQEFNASGFFDPRLYYQMHDIVHDFTQFLAKSKIIVIECDDIKLGMKSLEHKVSHLNLLNVKSNSSDKVLILKDIKRDVQRKLRTLVISIDDIEVVLDYDFIVKNLKGLRTLCLPAPGVTNLPQNISTLIHLRYLDLSNNSNLRILPESLCDLCNLQTLNLSKCYNLQRLPEGIGKVVKLRCLYVDGCSELQGLPKGVGKLTSIQKLGMIPIPKNNKEAYFPFGDLKNPNFYDRFQGFFRIKRCVNLANVGEAEKISLGNMKELLELSLNFRVFDGSSVEEEANPQNEDMILEALKPHPNLKLLTISQYHGAKSPSWMTSLINLKYLSLLGFDNCETLPPLGKLPCLESLQLSIFSSVKYIGIEFWGINHEEEDSFPKLRKLWFNYFSQWKKWEGSKTTATAATSSSSSSKVMPCLRSLRITYCRSLEALPGFLRMTPLEELRIGDSAILEHSCLKEWLHIPNIEINYSFVQKDGTWIKKENDQNMSEVGEQSCNIKIGSASSP
ncbi:putative disease resistance protein RGA3 isoform X1 [Cannabis sativa]|uniref:putative disease resistance protein RGA3 isoform X1 n=1 Tax=Cannabis sativa TaxID=3483 RepID=UPI0011DFC2D7|nr:putative disease resistance protein RGA3 isoform X1 [Cannabis sativa]XP_030510543.1 putative disease resistance protein RGA3 isoform X1 [Cannabis sativa]